VTESCWEPARAPRWEPARVQHSAPVTASCWEEQVIAEAEKVVDEVAGELGISADSAAGQEAEAAAVAALEDGLSAEEAMQVRRLTARIPSAVTTQR
jgi:hypothetical protein